MCHPPPLLQCIRQWRSQRQRPNNDRSVAFLIFGYIKGRHGAPGIIHEKDRYDEATPADITPVHTQLLLISVV